MWKYLVFWSFPHKFLFLTYYLTSWALCILHQCNYDIIGFNLNYSFKLSVLESTKVSSLSTSTLNFFYSRLNRTKNLSIPSFDRQFQPFNFGRKRIRSQFVPFYINKFLKSRVGKPCVEVPKWLKPPVFQNIQRKLEGRVIRWAFWESLEEHTRKLANLFNFTFFFLDDYAKFLWI